MAMIKEELINFFYHLKEERRSSLIWITLSVFIFLVPSMFRHLLPVEEVALDDFENTISELRTEIESEEKKTPYRDYNFPKKKKPYSPFKKKEKKVVELLKPFSFDPNTATEDDFLKMGLSQKRVNTILNFRNKGAKFFKKEDFKKIYGLSESEYGQLAPFIKIPPREKKVYPTTPKSTFAKEKKEIVKIDINESTEEDWQKLRGIGPYYAKKIVNFRDKLGGFASIEQIGATYGLKDSTFQVIKPFLIESPVFRKIKINTGSVDELKSHPYLKWQQAKTVVKYRENHGNFISIEDLGRVGVLSDSDLERLKPYVDFE